VPEESPRLGTRPPQTLWLCGLLFLLPFEPRRPTLALLGFQVTVLECAAAAALAALAWLSRRRLTIVLRRPPLPLALLALYAAAHVLSAALASAHADLAYRFALRMIVMAGCACVVSALPPRVLRAGLATLACSAGLLALLAILEGTGVRFLDPFLDRFRETSFNVGGSRRATAGSEYPNLAAAFLMYGLLAGVGLMVDARTSLAVALPFAVMLSTGLLFTFSRGALVAACVGLGALLALLVARRGGGLARAPAVALAGLVVSTAAFAAGREIFRLRLETESIESWYGADYGPAEATLSLRPGEVRSTELRVTNTGLKTWAVSEAFHLSYHWYDLDRKSLRDGDRTELPRDVERGHSVLLRPRIRAPDTEGRYLLVWDMVHEHTTWFSGQGVRPASVPTLVSRSAGASAEPPPPSAPEPPLAWRPSRGELWGLALLMWRERPWSGVGPDNFRWLHGPRAGHAFWDTRVFANNTLLEAAATTGTPGLLALLATLIALLVSSARGLLTATSPDGARLAAALFALGAGIAAHGAVDYVLAFTGHYLLFGFVVGGVSAASRVSGSPREAGPT
jgi:O-antigen ligase